MSVLALDVGGSHVACAIVEGGVVIARDTLPVAEARSIVSLLPAVAAAFGRLLCAGGIVPTRLGIAFPALLDPVTNRVLSTPRDKYADAVGFDFGGWARDQLGVGLRMDLDARVALLGERHAGALRGCDDAVMLTIGTGLGTAALIGGRLLRGAHAQAGVLGGHLSVAARGRPCICGGVGCLEAEASTWALPGLAAEDPGFPSSVLAAAPCIDFATVFAAAASGDAVATRLRARAIDVWSIAVVNLVHAYDPAVVVLGGGVMTAADVIVPPIAAHLRRHGWLGWGMPEIRVAACGADAALIGAEALWAEVR